MQKTILMFGTCVLALLMPLSICAGADSKWDYTQGGPSGVSKESAGRAGNFRTFECTTSDSTEKVVLWYAKQLGLRKDHSLVTIAEKGFSTLANPIIIKTASGNDTDQRKDHTSMVARLATTYAHVTFLHRPSFEGKQDVTISIASLPDGITSVIVISPTASEFLRSGGNPSENHQ